MIDAVSRTKQLFFTNKEKAIKELEQLLGAEFVGVDSDFLEEYAENVTALERKIEGVLYPKNCNEVKEIVRIANNYKIPLYPVSCGKNWGLGSRLPVNDNSIIVDLSRMNKIVEVDNIQGYAIIEPGVTQGQLNKYLSEKKLPFVFNVTGSAENTSVIGNALDRGVGYFSSKALSVWGFEIVLGNGTILNTGFGHYINSKVTYNYPMGIGPSLDGLFFQSNFGIVTRACVELIPKKDYQVTLVCGLKSEKNLVDFIDTVGNLKRMEFFTGVMHIGNRERSKVAIIPMLTNFLMEDGQISREAADKKSREILAAEIQNEWSGIVGLSGTKAQVTEAFRQIKKRMKKFGDVKFFTHKKLDIAKKICKRLDFIDFFNRKYAFLKTVEPLCNLTQGIPSNGSLWSLYYNQPKPVNFLDPDNTNIGHTFSLPLIPLTGADANKVVAEVKNIFGENDLLPQITLNTINSRTIGCVISLTFDRTDASALRRVHASVKKMNEWSINNGYMPYRVAINQMDSILTNSDYWEIIKKIKQVFDPNLILSKKRYCTV